MEVTPLEIQKQSFGRTMRGYSEDEVRAFLHLVAEEVETLLKQKELLNRENMLLREEVAENQEREKILKDTLLSAQKVSDDVRINARKEAELIVKDAEMLAEKMVAQAMDRVADLERTIQELKVERRAARDRVQMLLDTFQHVLSLDEDQERDEMPITQLFRRKSTDSGE